MPLLRNPWIVFDTETTGLPVRKDALPCEVAAVYVEPVEGQVVSTFSSLVRVPVYAWSEFALAVSGITPAEIAAAPTPAEVLAAFGAWACALPQEGVRTTAYNVPFDRQMLERLWNFQMPWGPCLMSWARGVMIRDGVAKGHRLADAARHFKVDSTGMAHRALADALTAAHVMLALARRRTGGVDKEPDPE